MAHFPANRCHTSIESARFHRFFPIYRDLSKTSLRKAAYLVNDFLSSGPAFRFH